MRAGCFDSPADDEVRQSDDEGSDGHQHTADRDDLGPMELGPKVTDESDDQQVAWRDRGGLEHQGSTLKKVTSICLDYLRSVTINSAKAYR